MSQASMVEPYGEFYSIVTPLKPCSNYEFLVQPVSPQGLEGPEEGVQGDTEEANPGQVHDISSKPLSTSEIEIHWFEPTVYKDDSYKTQ